MVGIGGVTGGIDGTNNGDPSTDDGNDVITVGGDIETRAGASADGGSIDDDEDDATASEVGRCVAVGVATLLVNAAACSTNRRVAVPNGDAAAAAEAGLLASNRGDIFNIRNRSSLAIGLLI
jgi:hypothetical protein